MPSLKSTILNCLEDITTFTSYAGGLTLRSYQAEVANAILNSIFNNLGLSFVIMFPRQSGKNEVQAQIEAYLLTRLQHTQAQIIKVSPTWKPQSINAMQRLERVLTKNILTQNWKKNSGYIYQLDQAQVYFFSGDPSSNIVGATASTLLEVDEAQDIQITKFDKDIAPMAASTNATRVFWGTAWTNTTLLAREYQAAQLAEKADGITRTFVLTADEVTKEVPAYGIFVSNQITAMGRNHPLIKTQYFSEVISSEGNLFPPRLVTLIQGDHPSQTNPTQGSIYALLIDIAGETEGADATTATIIEIDLSTLEDELIQKPSYLVVNRQSWQSLPHPQLYSQIKALAEHWQALYLVIDATGIGAGLTSFLETALPHRVIPFLFTVQSKSKLGWDFISAIETGRFKDHIPNQSNQDNQGLFQRQLEFTTHHISNSPNHTLSWSVPEGTRDPIDGSTLKDDLVMSAALCTILDTQTWGFTQSAIIPAYDPLESLTF